MIDLDNIAFSKPAKYETFTFEDGNGNKLVIREPFAYDFGRMETFKKYYANNTNWFYIAAIASLAETFNGKPGVTVADISTLDRKCYAQLRDKINEFQMSLIPDPASMPKYIQDILRDNVGGNKKENESLNM